jgi:hypothetical protein
VKYWDILGGTYWDLLVMIRWSAKSGRRTPWPHRHGMPCPYGCDWSSGKVTEVWGLITYFFMVLLGGLPSGKQPHNYRKPPFSMRKSTISMAMFNSYVKLPEGR